MTRKAYVHWKCLGCHAHGHSNSRDAERLSIDRHRTLGHWVMVWVRGHKNKATVLEPATREQLDEWYAAQGEE